MKNFRENLMHAVFFVCALTSIAAVVLICVFLFANGVPAMREIGLLDFLTGAKWKPGNDIYGILPMILGSIYITAGAVVIGVPIGLLTAIFMAYYCPKKLYGLLKPCTELLAGIPSIVYGLFGMLFFVTRLHWGYSLLAGAMTLAIMILPLIMLSGMVFPIENMPGVLQGISCIVPARWYIEAVRKLMVEGLPFAAVLKEFAVLAVMTGALIGVALGKFNDKLE